MEDAETQTVDDTKVVIQESDIEIVDVDAFVAKALTTFDPLVKKIDELKESVAKDVYDLTTTKGNKAARSMRANLKAIPGALEKAYTNWNQPRLRAAEAMRLRRDELSEMIPGIVKPLDDQITADEARREEERVAKEKAETARVGAIRQKIAGLSSLVVTLVSESSEKLGQVVDWLKQQEISKEVYAEFSDEAKTVLAGAIDGLEKLRVGALAREESERENERLRAEAAAQAEKDRLAREEQARLDKEAADKAAADKVEADKAAAELKAKEQAEADQKLADAQRVAEEHQNLLKQQKDAFEDERRVANYIALVQGRVAKVALMTDIADIDEELKSLREAEVEGATEELRAQVTKALNESIASIETLRERAVATNAALDAQVQSQAEQKAATAGKPQEAAAPAQEAPAAAPAADQQDDLQDLLLEANQDSAANQLSPEELAMQTIQETGGTARAPATARPTYFGGGIGRARPAVEQNNEPPAALKSQVDAALAAKRPSDWIILDTLSTTFGITHAEALDWVQDMDLFELQKKVEAL